MSLEYGDPSPVAVRERCPGSGRLGFSYDRREYCRKCVRGPFTLTKAGRIPTHKLQEQWQADRLATVAAWRRSTGVPEASL